MTVNVWSNVIHDVTLAAITASQLDTVHATVNIIGNTLDHAKRGVEVRDFGGNGSLTLNLYDTIVSNMTDAGIMFPAGAGLTVSAGYNDLFGNALAPVLNGQSLGSPLFTVDPLYEDTADYRLKSSSTLIDLGTNGPPGGLPPTDAAENQRLAGTLVDVGAFEFGATPTTTTTSTTSTTTTTTLPCAGDATVVSVTCRLGALATEVTGLVPPGVLTTKLTASLSAAQAAVQLGDPASGGARRKAFRKAAKAVATFGMRLASKPARTIGKTLRGDWRARAARLTIDLRLLAKG